VVIGGQQAGLFGGPLYTAFKALTILEVARRAEAEIGRAVVPVFWIASEDSDLAEVNHAHVAGPDGKLRELRLDQASQPGIPVSRIRLGEPVSRLIDELAALIPNGPFAADTLSSLRAAYTPGRTYPQAFGAWMARLFSGRGLLLVDPSDPRLKSMAFAVFEREIRERSPVTAAVLEQTGRLEKAGYHAQIDLRDGYLTLFHQEGSRDALMIEKNGFRLKASGRVFSADELCSLYRDRPDAFTPNAVMRPLFQDTLFPTLAVVLGPAEIAYFAQLTLAYQVMGIPMPLLFPRASLTLLDAKAEKLRGKLGVGAAEVIAQGERVIDSILRRQLPEGLSARVADARSGATGAWNAILAEIDRLDPTLHRTAEIGAGRSLRQVDFIERKIIRAARRKNDLLRRQVESLVAALAPRRGLQERTLITAPLLARHGTAVLDLAARAIDPFAAEHRVVVVES
jgi:bacillithiol biosynthesis cysteine-adding enzyme BshC